MYLMPVLLRKLSVRGFTTLANLGLAVAYCMRASERRLIYFLFMVPALPGVNGGSAQALMGLQRAHAGVEGFGMGEFSAWNNNLRAFVSAFATMLYGNIYAWSMRSGRHPGLSWLSAALLGAVLPELMMQCSNEIDTKPSGRQ